MSEGQWGPEAYLVTIGDIGITSHWVRTPNGVAPLRGSAWIATDMSVTQRGTPTWAIVVAVVGATFTCLLSLFLLLVKEFTTTGYVQVAVRSGDLNHMTQVPVWSTQQVAQVRALVGQAQALAAQAPPVDER